MITCCTYFWGVEITRWLQILWVRYSCFNFSVLWASLFFILILFHSFSDSPRDPTHYNIIRFARYYFLRFVTASAWFCLQSLQEWTPTCVWIEFIHFSLGSDSSPIPRGQLIRQSKLDDDAVELCCLRKTSLQTIIHRWRRINFGEISHLFYFDIYWCSFANLCITKSF